MSVVYETGRLNLFVPDVKCADALTDYYKKNREFLRPWDPERSGQFFTRAYQKQWIKLELKEMKKRQSLCLCISKKSHPDVIIGMIRLSNILFGNFCSAFIGYRLDKDEVNQGYMTEALNKVKQICFQELGLHRLEASTLPNNKASQNLLKKAGFRYIGYSEAYLKINGKWQAHDLFELCASPNCQ